MRHLFLLQRFLFKDNWMKELGSEVAGGVKTPNKPNQVTETPIVRTGRPVSSCVPVSVERSDKDKDADEYADADQIGTGDL